MTSSEHRPHSEHPGVHAETIPTRERIAKAHSRLPAEWHGWHAKLANGGYGHFAYHNAREACYICTLLDDLDGLNEQLETLRAALEQIDEMRTKPLSGVTGTVAFARACEVARAALYPAKNPDSYEVVDHTEAREDYHKEYME